MATLEDVYLKFGETSEAAQLLETELGTLLMMNRAEQTGLLDTPDSEKASDIYSSINRYTLGQLLTQLNKSGDEISHISELLLQALNERNRLSHSFYRQHNFRRNSDEGCEVMLKDLDETHDILLKAYIAVLSLSGIDLDESKINVLPTGHLPIG